MQSPDQQCLAIELRKKTFCIRNSVIAFGAFLVIIFGPCTSQTGEAVWGRKDAVSISASLLVCVLAFIISCSLCGSSGRQKRLLALFLACLSLVGEVLSNAGGLALLYSSLPRMARTIVYLPTMTWLLLNLLNGFHELTTSFCRNLSCSSFFAAVNSIHVSRYFIFVALLLMWLPYVIVFFPGSLPTDTARQLGQWFGVEGVSLDNHFPLLTTMVFGTIFKLGDAISSDGVLPVFLLTLFQYFLGAAVIATAFRRLSDILPTFLIFFGTAFIGIFPIVPVYVVSISKDYLHAIFVVLYIATLLAYINSREKQNGAKHNAILLVDSLLVSLTRNNGFYVCVFTFLFLAMYLRKRLIAYFGVAFFALYSMWSMLLLPLLGVAPSPTREMLSMPAQVVARIYSSGVDIPDDINDIVIDCWDGSSEDLSTCYNSQIADPAKRHLDFKGDSSTLDYLLAVIRLAITYPSAALSGALSTTCAYWYPFCSGTYWEEDAPYYSWDDWSLINEGWFKGSSWSDEWNTRHALDSAAFNDFHHNGFLSYLYKPGIYFWWLVYLLGWSRNSAMGRRSINVVAVPLFVLFATLVASPCASLRYTLPFIFLLPFFLYLTAEGSKYDNAAS